MKKEIPFNVPLVTGKEELYIQEAIRNGRFSGDGPFTKRCNNWLTNRINCKKALLTTSCTHALEMAALIIDINPGDEVIMSSFTFVSTANPFVLRGAKIIFVDICPDTMNINEDLIEEAITRKTKAIVPMHYAGVSCNMDKIMEIAAKYNLWVIEDAAQCILAYDQNNNHIGTCGHLSCFSFHETKNIHCGEGGAICINDENLIDKAEEIREKGTNRKQYLRGEVDKYSWVNKGSSYLQSELNAAFLIAQMETVEIVTEKRQHLWSLYYEGLKPLEQQGYLELPKYNEKDIHNGHIFFVKLRNEMERDACIKYLNLKNVASTFHYVPLHSSTAGKKFSVFCGKEKYTTKESTRLLRLPLYYNLGIEEVQIIINEITSSFK